MLATALLAQWELGVSASGRTYPEGGTLSIKGAYRLSLWGKPPAAGGFSPWHGYIRPQLEFANAGAYNYSSLQIEVFPVSFLGARAGGSATYMAKDYSHYDCEVLQCQGLLTSQFVEGQAVFGIGRLFWIGRYRWEEFEHDKQEKNFLEVESALIGHHQGDQFRTLRNILGWRLGGGWSIAAVHTYTESEELKGISRMATLSVIYNTGKWSLVLGGGVFDSDLKKRKATGVGSLGWSF